MKEREFGAVATFLILTLGLLAGLACSSGGKPKWEAAVFDGRWDKLLSELDHVGRAADTTWVKLVKAQALLCSNRPGLAGLTMKFYSVEDVKRYRAWADSLLVQNPKSKEALYFCADAAVLDGEYDLAFERLRDLMHDNPTWPLPFGMCGAVLTQVRRQYEAGIAVLDTAIILWPGFADAFNSRGLARLQIGDVSRAFADFDSALAHDPDFASAFVSRGYVHYLQGNLRASVSDYTRALMIDSTSVQAYSNRGVSHRRLRETEDALRDFEHAIRLSPRNPELYNNRGNTYLDKGDRDKAKSDYDIAIQLKPDYPEPYNNRAIIWMDRDSLENAASDLLKALELNPGLSEAYYSMGNLYSKHFEDDKEAIRWYNRAIAVDSHFARAYTRRGVAYIGMSDVANAMIDFQRALRIDSTQADALWFTAVTLESLGRKKEAVEVYLKFISVASSEDPTYAAKAKERIRSLRDE